MKKNVSKIIPLILYGIIGISSIITLFSVPRYGIDTLFSLINIASILSIAVLIGTTISVIKNDVTSKKLYAKKIAFWVYILSRVIYAFLLRIWLHSDLMPVLYEIICIIIIYISTYKLEKWINCIIRKKYYDSNKDVENFVINEIHNIEQQIQKIQEEPTKKRKAVLYVVSLIVGFGFLIAALMILKSVPTVSIVLCFIALCFIGVSLCGGIRELSGTNSKQSAIKDLQKQLYDLSIIDGQCVKFYLECTEKIKNADDTTNVLSVIGSKYGRNSISSAQAYYKKGAREFKKQEIFDKHKIQKIERADAIRERKNNDKSATVIGVSLGLILVFVFLFLPSNSDTTEKTRECEVCHREFKIGTKDYQSIRSTHMCRQCYKNYKYATESLKVQDHYLYKITFETNRTYLFMECKEKHASNLLSD